MDGPVRLGSGPGLRSHTCWEAPRETRSEIGVAAVAAMIEYFSFALGALDRVLKIFGLARASRLPRPRVDLNLQRMSGDESLFEAMLIVHNHATERIVVRQVQLAKRHADFGRNIAADVNGRPRFDPSPGPDHIELSPHQGSIAPGQKWTRLLYIRLKEPRARTLKMKVVLAEMGPAEKLRTVRMRRSIPAAAS